MSKSFLFNVNKQWKPNMAAKVENPDLLAIYDFCWIQIIIRQFILKFANAE